MFKEEIAHLPGYELIDTGEGERLERLGPVTVVRPDPAILWKKSQPENDWAKADAAYIKSGEDKGVWKMLSTVPERWEMHYEWNPGESVTFNASLTPFKHTGVFPEQVANWRFIIERLSRSPVGECRVLNLFGYTGIASVLCAKLGCDVTHVDASKPSLTWAKENMLASGLQENSIRWIYDDALKFVKREVRRGTKYNVILMDPPAFGRGPKGEVWKFNESLPELLSAVQDVAATGDDFRFMIINAYAVSVPSLLLNNLLEDISAYLEIEATVDHGELMLQDRSGRMLSTGLFARMYQ